MKKLLLLFLFTTATLAAQTLTFRADLKDGIEYASFNAITLGEAITQANAACGAVLIPAGEYHIDPVIQPGNKMYDFDGLTCVQGAGRHITKLHLPKIQATQHFNLFAIQNNTKSLTISGITVYGPNAPPVVSGFNPDFQPNTKAFYFENREIGNSTFFDIAILGGFKTAIDGNRNLDHPMDGQRLTVRDFEIETYHNGIAWFSSSKYSPEIVVENGSISAGTPSVNGGEPRGSSIYIHPHIKIAIFRNIEFPYSTRRVITSNGSGNPESAGGRYLIENCEFGENTNVAVLLPDLMTGIIRNCEFKGGQALLVRNTITVEDSFFDTSVPIVNYGVDLKPYRANFARCTFLNGSVVVGSSGSVWTFTDCDWFTDENAGPISGQLLTSKNMATRVLVRGGSFVNAKTGSSLISMVRHRGGDIKLDGVRFEGLAPFNGAILTSDQANETHVKECVFDFVDGGQTFPSRAFWHDAGLLHGADNLFYVDRINEGLGYATIKPADVGELSVTASATLFLDPNVSRYIVTGADPIEKLDFGLLSSAITGPVYLISGDDISLSTGGDIQANVDISYGRMVTLIKTSLGWVVQ